MRKTIISSLLIVIVLVGFSIYLSQLNAELKDLRQANDELVTNVNDLTSRIDQLENSVGTQSVSSMDDIGTRLDDLQDKVEGLDGLQSKVEDLDSRIFDLELWSK